MAAALGLGLRRRRRRDLASAPRERSSPCASAPIADPTGVVAGFADATGRFLPLVCTLNATKVTDTVARLLGVALDELDQLALDVRGRARAASCSSPTSTANAHPTARPPPAACWRPAFRHRAATDRPRRVRGSGVQPARRARRARATPASPRRRAGSSSWVVGLARWRTNAWWPTSPSGRCWCPRSTSTSHCGACVQAAAMLGARDVMEVAARLVARCRTHRRARPSGRRRSDTSCIRGGQCQRAQLNFPWSKPQSPSTTCAPSTAVDARSASVRHRRGCRGSPSTERPGWMQAALRGRARRRRARPRRRATSPCSCRGRARRSRPAPRTACACACGVPTGRSRRGASRSTSRPVCCRRTTGRRAGSRPPTRARRRRAGSRRCTSGARSRFRPRDGRTIERARLYATSAGINQLHLQR